MKTYVWYHILNDELILSSHRGWPQRAIELWNDEGYWVGPAFIVKHDFIFLGEL